MGACKRQAVWTGVVTNFVSLIALLTLASLSQDAADCTGGLRPTFQRISRYRDNFDITVDRRQYPQFSFVGELESLTDTTDGDHVGKVYGTGVLISPCYVLTNHHVAFGGEIRPADPAFHLFRFRIGVGAEPGTAFLGNTIAMPVMWGNRGTANVNDWAILRLRTCVGARSDTGWIEPSSKTSQDLVGLSAAVVGFAGDASRGMLNVSIGKLTGIESANGFLMYSASAVAGESGAPVMVREDGELRLVALHTVEFVDKAHGSNVFDTYSDEYANIGIPIESIMSNSDVRKLIDYDKSKWGMNPANERLRQPILAPRRL